MKLFSEDKTKIPIIAQKSIDLFESLDDMWLYNWDKLNKTNNLKWLIKNEGDRDKFVAFADLDARFLVLMDEWYVLTDANSSRSELNTLMKKAIVSNGKAMRGDKFEMNWVNRYNDQIEELVGDNSGYDPNKQRAQVSAALKMFIDKKAITVVDYYNFVEVAIEMNSTKTEDNG